MLSVVMGFRATHEILLGEKRIPVETHTEEFYLGLYTESDLIHFRDTLSDLDAVKLPYTGVRPSYSLRDGVVFADNVALHSVRIRAI